MTAEVAEQPGVQQGGELGAVADLAELPGVYGKGHEPVRQGQFGSGEPCREQGRGDSASALRPGGVGGEQGGSDSHPVQGEGTAQLG
ncbi:hypothetical protein RKD24_005032 [Streptomyces calvus]